MMSSRGLNAPFSLISGDPNAATGPAGVVLTIGHSNHALDHFIEIVRGARLEMIIDIRAFPRSRTNPQFNIETLPEHLARYQIGYEHWPDLGGRRARQASISPDTNAFWHNQSFHNFADYALGPAFQEALARLIELAQRKRPGLMCSEAVWWRCHRRIISDHLLARGLAVRHVMGAERIAEATMTPGAEIDNDGRVRYPHRLEA